MLNMKTLAAAAAISVGFAFAMPATSQAMPVGPVKIQDSHNSNIVDVRHKKWHKRKKWRESRRWRHSRRFARYCDPWDGCYRRHRHARLYRYWDEPYYGYGGYPYDYPYYGGYYGPGFYGPGIGFQFRIR